MSAVRRTVLVTFAPGSPESERDQLVRTLESAGTWPGIAECRVRPTLPGAVRGGDLVWHLAGPDDSALAACDELLAGTAVQSWTSATYDEGRTATRDVPGTRPVHRTLLLRAEADEDTLRRFEDELFAMGDEIRVMRLWRLSRVRPGGEWTHVWEQVFADLSGLERAYMRHPYHWGQVDRWFDGESPDRIVLPTFCHTFCML